jgi:hypothetical protein
LDLKLFCFSLQISSIFACWEICFRLSRWFKMLLVYFFSYGKSKICFPQYTTGSWLGMYDKFIASLAHQLSRREFSILRTRNPKWINTKSF